MSRRQRHNLLAASLFPVLIRLRHLLQNLYRQLVDKFIAISLEHQPGDAESQRLLYRSRPHRAGDSIWKTLSLHYDLLWNRLDVFWSARETADARSHGLEGRGTDQAVCRGQALDL